MVNFLDIVVSNSLIAAVLAVLATALTRSRRHPHVAHGLWLLVFVKLITPSPVGLSLPKAWFSSDSTTQSVAVSSTSPLRHPSKSPTEPLTEAKTETPSETSHQASVETPVNEPKNQREPVSTMAPNLEPTPLFTLIHLASAVWLIGAGVFLFSLARRCYGFRKLLSTTEQTLLTDVDPILSEEVVRFAEFLGIRCPRVRVIDARIPPLVWCIGRRPVILLPKTLLAGLDAMQRQAVLVHELAHIRRGDHFTRQLETFVLLLYWWNPIVWWARRQIRQTEEECCDAWVVWALPEGRRSYGKALLRTIEFLTERPAAAFAGGSAFGGFLFKRRIEMILKQNLNRKMSKGGWAVVLLLGALVMPLAAQTGDQQIETASVRESQPPSSSDRAASAKSDVGLEDRVKRLEALVEKLVKTQQTAHQKQLDLTTKKYLAAEKKRNDANIKQAQEALKTRQDVLQQMQTKTRGLFGGTRGRGPAVRRIAVSKDGKQVAILSGTGKNYELELFNTNSGKLNSKTRLSAQRIRGMEFSPDGKKVAVLIADKAVVFEARERGQDNNGGFGVC